MSIAWHVQLPDGDQGPLDPAGMRALVQTGRITPETLVRREPMTRWVPAGQVRGLLPEVRATPVPRPAVAMAEPAPMDAPAAASNPFEAPIVPTTRRAVRTAGRNRVPYRSARTLAIVLTVIFVGAFGSYALLTHQFQVFVSSEEDFLPPLLLPALVSFLALALAQIVVWCLWTYRVVNNSHPLGAKSLRCSPGWAVGSYFIPILNLFKPYQAINEAWTWSGMPNQRGRPSTRGAGLVLAWWLVWIIGSGLERLATMFAAPYVSVLIYAVISGLALAVVWKLTARQDYKAARRRAGGGTAAVTTRRVRPVPRRPASSTIDTEPAPAGY